MVILYKLIEYFLSLNFVWQILKVQHNNRCTLKNMVSDNEYLIVLITQSDSCLNKV